MCLSVCVDTHMYRYGLACTTTHPRAVGAEAAAVVVVAVPVGRRGMEGIDLHPVHPGQELVLLC